MSTFLSDKPKNNTRTRPLGAIGFYDEVGSERETSSVTSVVKEVVGGISEGVFSLLQEVGGVETKSSDEKLAIGGKTELKFDEKRQAKLEEDQKKSKIANNQRAFYQDLKNEQIRIEMSKNKPSLEEEINDAITSLSNTDKNDLLHLQASYRNNNNVYQRAELRRKLVEKRKMADKQQKESSIPSPGKKISALDGAFEGASGSVGSGTANFGKGSVQ